MEAEACPFPACMNAGRSEVDTSRPFRSVKEAVALFDERLLFGEVFSQSRSLSFKRDPPSPKAQKSPPSSSYSTSSSRFNQDRDEEIQTILSSMKKLEVELEDTKRDVILLKEKAKLAEVEAAGGVFMEERRRLKFQSDSLDDERETGGEEIVMEGKYEYLPSFAAALKLGHFDGDSYGRRSSKAVKKKKPIVPLIGDLFA